MLELEQYKRDSSIMNNSSSNKNMSSLAENFKQRSIIESGRGASSKNSKLNGSQIGPCFFNSPFGKFVNNGRNSMIGTTNVRLSNLSIGL
jgi:hypothetical protein